MLYCEPQRPARPGWLPLCPWCVGRIDLIAITLYVFGVIMRLARSNMGQRGDQQMSLAVADHTHANWLLLGPRIRQVLQVEVETSNCLSRHAGNYLYYQPLA
jgi:hypothetical protein